MGNGRKTVYNSISSPDKLTKVNPENVQLGNDFLEYLTSIDRSKSTVDAYRNDLNIFGVGILTITTISSLWIYLREKLQNTRITV